MKIIDIIKAKKPVISFEIFPPKSDMPIDAIFDSLCKFCELNPDYISVTYGAGGSQKGRTVEIASKIKNENKIESMAHFTCIGHTKDDIDNMLKKLKESNIDNVLALRGDPPKDQADYDFSMNVFKYANELIEYIKSKEDFCIAAAAYVEGHIDALRIKDDLNNLKIKVDSGADFLVTQLFFDNRLFFDFIDRIRALGINCPVMPGIMPVFKADLIKSIAYKSGCSIPAKLVLIMDKYGHDAEDMRKAGIEYASLQIRELLDNGADGIHLYTMNRPKSTKEILVQSGIYK